MSPRQLCVILDLMSDEDEDFYAVIRIPLWRKLAIGALFLAGVIAAGFYILGPEVAQNAREQKMIDNMNIPPSGP